MGSEVKYVMEENWDFLIVLDACRYDYFNKFYRDFFNSGTLQKAISPGRETVEWCVKNFTEYYHDVIYISPIPFINSMKAVKYRGFYFDAKKHFYRVVDLWKHGWDNTLQTVRPEAVNTAALTLLKLHPNKRLIIHYMQPHAPYLSLNVPSSNILPKKLKKSVVERVLNTSPILEAKTLALNALVRNIGTETVWRLNKIFGFRNVLPSHMEMAWRLVGKEGVRKAYVENLKIVLGHVKGLIEHLHGKIVITADHGELLGEDGLYEHGIHLPRHPKLVEIPWFIVEK